MKLRCRMFGHSWTLYQLWSDYNNKYVVQYVYCARCLELKVEDD